MQLCASRNALGLHCMPRACILHSPHSAVAAERQKGLPPQPDSDLQAEARRKTDCTMAEMAETYSCPHAGCSVHIVKVGGNVTLHGNVTLGVNWACTEHGSPLVRAAGAPQSRFREHSRG